MNRSNAEDDLYAADMTQRFIALDTNAQPLTPDATHVITRDSTTGLEWASASDKGLTHKKAIAACEAVKIAGGGWRAPTLEELLSIIDSRRHHPAIDAEPFPFVTSNWYWTSTPAAWSSASAWSVYFGYGYVDYYHRGYVGFALAVRRAGSSRRGAAR